MITKVLERGDFLKDGSFIYQNKEISFKISDNNTPVVIRGDLEKMTRCITFYYGINNLGTYSNYVEVE